MSGRRSAAIRAASTTFDRYGAPSRPPPQRRAPTVVTRASAASSRKSDAACCPARARASRSATLHRVLARVDQLGLGRAAAAHRDDHHVRSARVQHPGDVPRHGRLADPLAGADHGQGRRVDRPPGAAARRRSRGRGSRGRRRPPGRPARSGRARPAPARRRGRAPRSRRAWRRPRPGRRPAVDSPSQLQRHAVVGHAVELLGSAEQQRRHHLGVLARLAQGRAHHRRIVLAVDQRQHAVGHGPPPAFGRFFS